MTFKSKQLIIGLAVFVLAGCTSRVAYRNSAPQEPGVKNPSADDLAHNQLVPEGDPDASVELSQSCLHAWRQAVAGHEDQAMKELKELDKKYPQATTVRFMMGQVEDKFGKKKIAQKYYEDSVTKSRYNQMYLFKLAESYRTTGDTKDAIPRYRMLLRLNSTFTPAMLGLARCLWAQDKNNVEAADLVKQVLDQEPENPEALSMFKSMMSQK